MTKPLNKDDVLSTSRITPVITVGLLQSLIEDRCLRDSSFLALVATDDSRAFFELTGLQLPRDFRLVETAGRISMRIPEAGSLALASSGSVWVLTTDNWRMIIDSPLTNE
jgi:hypothetical protein